MNRLNLFIAAAVAFPTTIHAQAESPTAAMMDGKCHKFIFAGTDATSLCEGKLVNIAYADGHSSFMFMLKDKAIISFYGSDSAAIGDKAAIKVEKLTLNLLMGTPSSGGSATGKCSYTNPYAGPSLVECFVISQGKRFEATFVSNGQKPSVMGE